MTRVAPPHLWTNILDGVTATNSAPSAATDGIKVPRDQQGEAVVIRVRHTTTAGNDARTFTLKLWGYCPGEETALEGPTNRTPTAVSSSSGWDDMGEQHVHSSSADGNETAFVLNYPNVYDRLYVEVSAISGTGTSLGVAAAFSNAG